MNTQKSTTLTLPIKAGLKAAAVQEYRSITNMVEVLIRDYCREHNIVLELEDRHSLK